MSSWWDVVTVREIFEPVPTPDSIPSPIIARVVDDRANWRVALLFLWSWQRPPTADADPSDAPELGYHILLGDSLFLNGAQTLEPNQGDWVQFYRWWVNRTPNAQSDDWQIEAEDINGDGQEAIYEIRADQLALYGIDNVGEYPIHFMRKTLPPLRHDSSQLRHAATISVINILKLKSHVGTFTSTRHQTMPS